MPRHRPGDSVTDDVRLVRALRRGGMGSVWLAHHAGLDTEVVVKLLADGQSDEEGHTRFLREAAAAARVHSPHVVRIYDYGVAADGEPYIVMEYLEGEDLGRVIQARGRLAPEEVAHVVEQTGRALDATHRRGILHRDVKPANIFLIDVGARLPHVKLVDFGVAKAATATTLTSTGQLVGTPLYMSPEQIAGDPIDHRSDLWSLGVVVFRALTGQRPFRGEAVASVAYQVVHGALPRPSERAPDLTEGIDAWFARACARDPNERYPHGRAMADALWEAIGMPQAASSGRGTLLSGARSASSTSVPLASPAPATSATPATALRPPYPEEPTAGSLKVSFAQASWRRPRARWMAVGAALLVAAAGGLTYIRGTASKPSNQGGAQPTAREGLVRSLPLTLPASQTTATPASRPIVPTASDAPTPSAPPRAASARPPSPPLPRTQPGVAPEDLDLGF
ncbi:MAG: protein kinase [Myxococcota bacterium]